MNSCAQEAYPGAVWTACLTVGRKPPANQFSQGFNGFTNPLTNAPEHVGELSPSSFTLGGNEYTVEGLTVSDAGELSLTFYGVTTMVEGTLHIGPGGTPFAISDADQFPFLQELLFQYSWSDSGLTWNTGDQIAVALVQDRHDRPQAARREPVDTRPLHLALWTDRPGYRPGEPLRLYRTVARGGDRGKYEMLFYLERADGGQRRYLSPGTKSMQLREQAVDYRGRPLGFHRVGTVPEAERELTWEGAAPEPGLWQFVAELRADNEHDEPKRASAKFAVAAGSQLLIRRGFERDVTEELTLRGDRIHYLGSRLFVRAGATLRLEAGTLVMAWGPEAAIIVEPGGRIEAEGTREAPVVLTCTLPAASRAAGCWGGVWLMGRAPVTGGQAAAGGVPSGRAAYGGSDPGDSSGWLRYVRVEFAGGSAGSPAAPVPALGLYGVGSGTVVDHVQTHASQSDGILFSGGTVGCAYCVASGSGAAGLAWERGWRGHLSHLYVQQGNEGIDGILGGNDSQGYDLEPRSRPTLANVTVVRSRPIGRGPREGAGLRLREGTAVVARDLLVARFEGGAIHAGGRSAQLFAEGASSVVRAILHRNGYRPGRLQLRGGIHSGVEFEDRDPKLRNVVWGTNPDPRPMADSPAVLRNNPADVASEGETAIGGEYVGAFGKDENWLEGWTFFGAESDSDFGT